MNRFEGKSAIVTGATAGIGLATAERLAREGAALTIVARDPTRGEEIATGLGADVQFVAGDVAAEGTATLAVQRALDRFGGLHVLVNNAGLDHSGALLSVPEAEVRRVLETNFLAAWRLLVVAAREMLDGGGAIVNVTSRLATIGVPEMAIYGASKGALSSLTRGAAVELAPRGIRVNAVAPGLTDTPLAREWLAHQEDAAATMARVTATIPQGRFATADEVASAIAFIASEDASHVTGATLAVDGGYTAT